MMLKTFLAWAGIMAVHDPLPRIRHLRCEHPRNDEAHESANREQALFSGAQAVVRQANRLSHVMDTSPADTTRIQKGVSDMRSTLAEVARRADR